MYNLGNGTPRHETGLAPADYPYPEQVSWAFSWGSNSPEQLAAYDINADGWIDAADIALAFAGQTPTGATSAEDRAYVEKHQSEFGEEAVEAVRETTLALDLIRAEEEKLRLREEELNQRDRAFDKVNGQDQVHPAEAPFILPGTTSVELNGRRAEGDLCLGCGPSPHLQPRPGSGRMPVPTTVPREPVAPRPQRSPVQSSPLVPIVLIGAAFLLLR